MKQLILLICAFLIAQTAEAQRRRDTVRIVVDTVPEKNKANTDKRLFEEIQRDIEKQNQTNTPPPQYKVVEKPIEQPKKDKKETKPLAKPPKHYKHEIGLETGAFFSQVSRLFGLANKDTLTEPFSPYQLAYKYRPNEKGAFRAGAGTSWNRWAGRLGGFADTKTVTRSSYDFRLGYEFTKSLDDRWVFMPGVDLGVGFANERGVNDSGFDVASITSKATTFGFSVVAGIRYDFNWRMSLGSETRLGFVNSKKTIKETFTSNPQFNRTLREESEQKTRFYGPANVYLCIRF